MVMKYGKTCVHTEHWELTRALPFSIAFQNDNSSRILLMDKFYQFSSLGLASEAAWLCSSRSIAPAKLLGHTDIVL